MCGRLVNLDTVARVLAEYYHLKTETQLAALDEALSRVPAETVGGGHKKDHVADPGKMVGDLISRQAAIEETWKEPSYTDPLNVLTELRDRIKDLPPAQPERKKGKWIRDGHHIRCDQCGMYMCDTDREGDRIPTEFCPNCGSYNGGEQDDSF